MLTKTSCLKFFFIFICFFNYVAFAKCKDKITPVEKLKIKYLFERLFKLDSLAYTLFFDKPLSFSEVLFPELSHSTLINIMNIEEYTNLVFSPNISSNYFEEAWEIWEKHQSELLNEEKYLFIKKKFDDKPIILLINKNEFDYIFNQHLEKFQSKFPNTHSLIQKIKDPNIDLNKLFDHVMLGILLGYGEQNSKLFEERELKEKKMRQLSCLSPSSKIKSKLQKQIDNLWKILSIKNDDHFFAKISLCFLNSFVSDQQLSETKDLKKKYREQTKEISEIMYAPDWFEQILFKLKN